ncbi:MAG: hypothetical protein ACFHXK_12610 [bacterium]
MSSRVADHPWSETVALNNWEFASSAAGARVRPEEATTLDWQPAKVPGTVAAQLWGDEPLSYDSSLALDDDDFWYRVEFSLPPVNGAAILLHLKGLATFAEVWLDNNLVLKTDNMFCTHTLDLTQHAEKVDSTHWLYIHFCALTPFLNKKHARAKWRTPFVQHRNLRFVRTSLMGRTPGLQPLIPVVGPWRPVLLEMLALPDVTLSSINVSVAEGLGVIDAVLSIQGLSHPLGDDALRLYCEGKGSTELKFVIGDDGSLEARARLEIENPSLWWPHTHGEPTTYPLSVRGELGGRPVSLTLRPIGFRTVELKDPFAISINGVQLFCRGACWRPLEFLSMNPSTERLRRILDLAVAAGMNMLRITGETAYETDEFYQMCDELGIMVWQDFMFARLDYPVENNQFLSSIRLEATQVLRRLASHPCLTMLCGNTEVAQQAAMLGLEREKWSNSWFDSELPNVCARMAPGIPYWRSSPDGGDMPFYTDSGVSHYFGVGAYRQELSDAVVNAPVFASECLAFGIPSMGQTGELAAVASLDSPADANANWSFLDVAEYYAEKLYGKEILSLKESDIRRYRQLCSLAVGEVMYALQTGWRAKGIRCNGSLVISLNDVIAGNGWGLIDSQDRPKTPFYYVKRAWQPLGLTIVNRGVNGLRVIVHNDKAEGFMGILKLSLCRNDGVVLFRGEQRVQVDAADSFETSVEHVMGQFVDSGYTYQFGAAGFDYVFGEVFEDLGEKVDETVFNLRQARILPVENIDVKADVAIQSDGRFLVTLVANRFVQLLNIDTNGYDVSDNYFHLVPNEPKAVVVGREGALMPSRIIFLAQGLNMSNAIELDLSIAGKRSQERV